MTTADTRAASRQQVAETIYGLLVDFVRGLPRDLSPTSVATLSTLERRGPHRITDLAAVQGVTQPSMTTLIANLERAGYVERRADPDDRRVARVAVTPAGSAYLHARRRAGAEAVAELLDHLPDGDMATLAAAAPALDLLRDLHHRQRDPALRSAKAK
jgi:DNA-binding MarR family transcriptional regulator